MKISVVGSGIKSIDHLTLESVEKMKSCKKVCHLVTHGQEFESYLKSWGVNSFESYLDLYTDGDEDLNNYKRIFSKLLEDSKKHKDICLVVTGHPRLGVSIVQWLEAFADKFGIDLEVLPGISSFDTMTNDAGVDPIEVGTVLVDANRLITEKYNLDSRLDHYIYHVCSVGTSRVHITDSSKDNDLESLKKCLLKFYSEDHIIKFMSSSNHRDTEDLCIEMKLKNLEDILEFVHFGITLFVPSVSTLNRQQKMA